MKPSIYFVDAKHAFDSDDLFFSETLKTKSDGVKTIEVKVGIKLSSPIFDKVLQYLISNKGEIIFERGEQRFKIGGNNRKHHVEIHPYEQVGHFIKDNPDVIPAYAAAVYEYDQFLDLITD